MAQYEEITIDQGTDVSIEIHLTEADGTPKDLTGNEVVGLVKRSYSAERPSATFHTSIPDPKTGGKVILSLTNRQTDAMKAGRYVYDIELHSVHGSDDDMEGVDEGNRRGFVERVLEGRIRVTPSVTR